MNNLKQVPWNNDVKKLVWSEMTKFLRFAEKNEKGEVPMDSSIIEYVTVLIQNGKTQEEVAELLDAFLTQANVFSSWLFAYLKGVNTKLKMVKTTVQQAPSRAGSARKVDVKKKSHVRRKRPIKEISMKEEDAMEIEPKPKQRPVVKIQTVKPEQTSGPELTKEESTDSKTGDFFYVVDNPQNVLKGDDFDICWEFVSIYGCRKKDLCNWRHDLPADRSICRSVHKSQKKPSVPDSPYIRRYTPYGTDSAVFRNISWVNPKTRV